MDPYAYRVGAQNTALITVQIKFKRDSGCMNEQFSKTIELFTRFVEITTRPVRHTDAKIILTSYQIVCLSVCCSLYSCGEVTIAGEV